MHNKKASGFTLIELVIGIVVLSISFTVLFQMILPTATQGATQIHQIRAAELGQSIMSEIMGKAFDDNSDMMGGMLRCGEYADKDGNVDQTCTVISGDETDSEEGNNRSLFDDVDDYNYYLNNSLIEDSLSSNSDTALADLYKGFTVNINVINDGNYDGVPDSDFSIAKLITITVTTAEGVEITFSSYKANF
ncbi:type IV pilus modification PilV family protein [Pseudocolwellia sp. HL-MZ19]|uniref:type IV pilus modification PilV family protein n=1 Tax=Pseudocolwellia sp. HL-MZ19 TaxID=3400846 RepID=UPI003CEB24F8